MPVPPAIAVEEVVKRFGDTVAVDRATVEVGAGEIVALLGPSGSGKTTVLRLVAGFEVPDAGTVSIGGQLVAGPGAWVEPDRRRVGMVFQEGALFPHLSVGANVAFGRPAAGVAERCLELVGLGGRASSYPHELSGGERQRVALARALAIEPEVVLLDEPFASLDTALRVELRDEIASILRSAGASALLVTHDQDEALSMADRVVVMHDGAVEQTGTPEALYDLPATHWVSQFLGSANVLPGRLDGAAVDTVVGRAPVRPGGPPDVDRGGSVDAVVRPEALGVGAPHGPAVPADAVEGTVVRRWYRGGDLLVRVEVVEGATVDARVTGRARWREGDRVAVWITGDVAVLPSTSPAAVPER